MLSAILVQRQASVHLGETFAGLLHGQHSNGTTE